MGYKNLTDVRWETLTAVTYLLTPWCRVRLEKLTGLQLVKKFPAFHGTRSFITAHTNVRHLSLSWASPIQSIHPHLTSWRSILILSTHLRLGLHSGSFPPVSPPRPYTPPYIIVLWFVAPCSLVENYRLFGRNLLPASKGPLSQTILPTSDICARHIREKRDF